MTFLQKNPTFLSGRGLNKVPWGPNRKINAFNWFTEPKNPGLVYHHAYIKSIRNCVIFAMKIPTVQKGRGQNQLMWGINCKMNACNRFSVPENHGLEYHHAYINSIWKYDIFAIKIPTVQKGRGQNQLLRGPNRKISACNRFPVPKNLSLV